MPINHQDLLAYAQSCDLSLNETVRRAATSRAFYGAYHGCRELCSVYQVPTFSDTDGGSHAQLIDALENCVLPDKAFKREAKILGVQLRQMRTHRRMADYDIDDNYPKESAAITVRYSQKLIERVDGLLQAIAA